jgi:hypothetical protein
VTKSISSYAFRIGLVIWISSYSLHVSAADYHFTTVGRRQGREAYLDINLRPPLDDCRPSDTRHYYQTDGTYPRFGVDAGGASDTRACSSAFTTASILPRTLATRSRTCIACLTREFQLSRDSFPSDKVLALVRPFKVYSCCALMWVWRGHSLCYGIGCYMFVCVFRVFVSYYSEVDVI